MKNYYKEEDYIHYSNCHEDPNVLLSLIKKTDKFALSVASAGDNSFSLLTHNFSKVVVFDYNNSQLALVKLKACGIKYLTYDEFLIFIGIVKGDSIAFYNQLKKYLDKDTLTYFDNHLFLIKDLKLVNCGRFEHYFSLFKKYILKFTHSKKVLNKFMNASSIEEQWEIYKTKFNNFRWKLLFKMFFSDKTMKRHGRDKDYFAYASGSLSTHLTNRLELGFKNVLNKDNPYLNYAVYNEFKSLPHYLIKENFLTIKENIDNLIFIKGNTFDIFKLNYKFDFFNLSDIFEYMNKEETLNNEKMFISISNKNALFVYWNMMVDRKFISNDFKEIDSYELFKKDKGLYYSALRVYEVIDNDN